MTAIPSLLSAIYGAVNELRVYHMRNGAESGVARFTETARTLFPEIMDDPEPALTVAEAMIMLHRRLERAVARAARAAARHRPRRRRAGVGRSGDGRQRPLSASYRYDTVRIHRWEWRV